MSMTVIEHIELTGSESSIVLDEIPADYTDLIIVLSLRSSFTGGSNSNMLLRLNDSTGTYTTRGLQGNGSSTSSSDNIDVIFSGYTYIGSALPSATTTANTFSNVQLYFPNYASSNAKSFSTDSVMENNATYSVQHILGHLWSGTAAINKVEIFDSNGNFVQYSSATLYGITAGSDGTTTVS